MISGPFNMTNLEGLFSPFRDLDDEIDELRTMRRVSQIWEEMERRERGAWMMFGRFFDRQMDNSQGLSSPLWSSNSFSPRSNSVNDHSSSSSGYFSNKPESSVVVEFPEEEKEIKIHIEEPSVVITEVEDSPEPTEVSSSSGSRKSSLINSDDIINNVFHNDEKVIDATSVKEEHIVKSVDINTKTEKFEKRTKKVDFSKMEVHFEPGSGKVNIVETNEKPPSNQLFRRKRRHRVRSDSPKLNFVGHSDVESFENISPDPQNYESRMESPALNPNVKFIHLTNSLDLSIFNLRNALFENSKNHNLIDNKTNNLLISSHNASNEGDKYVKPKFSGISHQNILSEKNFPEFRTSDDSFGKSMFNVSSKLQNMIKNSVKHQINVQPAETKRSNTDKIEKSKEISESAQNFNIRPVNSISPSYIVKGKTNSLKRNNSKVRDIKVTLVNSPTDAACHWSAETKSTNRKKVAVSRSDSIKKNARVVRQESLKSTSSRGSINSDKSNQRKNNLFKECSRRDDARGRINRTPSIGKLTSNSLKKGVIYVDARPRKTKGATVTLISYSTGERCSNISDKETSNIIVNNLDKPKVRNKVMRNENLRSYCSKESLNSYNKFAQKINNDSSKLSSNETSFSSIKDEALNEQTHNSNVGESVTKLNNLSSVDQVQRISAGSNYIRKMYSRPQVPLYKQDSFRSGNSKVENVRPLCSRMKRVLADSECRTQSRENENNSKKGALASQQFRHETSSLFQPIKKERTIQSSNCLSNEIKTPVAIRKKSSALETENDKPKETQPKLTRTDSKEKTNHVRSDHRISRIPTSKASLASLRRSKEPLRSFEKISNGWVGHCNMSAVSRSGQSRMKWSTNQQVVVKENNQQSSDVSRNMSSPSTSSRFTLHQQKESVMRLSENVSRRRTDSQSTSNSRYIEINKKSRNNVQSPMSVSSHSSTLSRSRIRTPSRQSTPVPSEPIYESMKSHRKTPTPTPTSTLARRSKRPSPCCNI